MGQDLEMNDIHNRKQRNQKQIQKLETNPEIQEANKETVKQFINQLKAENTSKDRIKNYVWSFNTILPHTDFKLENADREDLIKLVGKINDNELGRKYSAHSKAEFRKTLSKYYRSYIGDEEILDFMQIDPKKKNISKLKAEELPKPRHVQTLAQEAKNIRDQALIMTLWDTGARIEAVLNLKWKNFEPGKNTSDNYIRFTERNKTMLRKIPVAESVPVLKKWMDKHPKPEKEEYIFTKFEGNQKQKKKSSLNQLKYSTAYQQIKRVRNKADIDEKVKTNPHAFRKGRATFLAATGMNVNMLAKYMGWNDISTAQKYVSLAQNQLDEAFQQAIGLQTNEANGYEVDREKLKPGRCETCQEIVSPVWNRCPSCGTSINPEGLLSILEKEKEEEIEKAKILGEIKGLKQTLQNSDLDTEELDELIE